MRGAAGVWAIVVGCGASEALAQEQARTGQQEGTVQTAQAGIGAPAGDASALAFVPMIDPPDEVSSRAAFAFVRAALGHVVKAVASGDDTSMQAADLAPPDGVFPGACVTLREVGGRLLARGMYVGTTRSVEFATQRAMEQAVGSLPATRDVLQRRAASEQLARAIVTVELSGQPTPLRPATYAEVDSDLQMGLDGVLAVAPTRDGEQSHGVFPLAMLVGGTPPSRAVMSAISVASGDPTLAIAGVKAHEAEAVRNKGVRLFRLRVRQLAQLGPEPDFSRVVEPVQLVRGSRLLHASDLSTTSLRDVLVRMTEHVVRRGTSGDGQAAALWEELRPLEGLQQGFAGPTSSAVAAFAMLHAAKTIDASASALAAQGEGVRAAAMQEGALRARRLAEKLLVQQFAEDDLFAIEQPAAKEAVEAAAWLAALMAGDGDSVIGASLREQPWFVERVQGLVSSVLLGLRMEENSVVGFADAVPDSTRGLFAFALSSVERSDAGLQASGRRADELEGWARGAMTQAYLSAGPGDLVSQLPWLWWAQVGMSSEGEDLPGALLELRAHVWENQVREAESADVVGGIVLREQLQASGKAMPTWQGLRPLAFAASALRDGRMTGEGQRMSELVNVLRSVRFARQLVTDESCGWGGGLEAGRSEHRAVEEGPTMLWGVKAAPWDHRLPLDASVAGVLAMSEVVRSLEAIAKGQQPAGQRPGQEMGQEPTNVSPK